MKFKKYLYTSISLLLVVGAAGLIVLWEFYLNDKINTKMVYVAAKTIESRGFIQEDDIRLERRDIKDIPPNAITDKNEIIGKKTIGIIEEKDIVTSKKILSTEQLSILENQKTFPIPSDWILAVPGSLQRGDRVDIYLMADPKKTTGIGKIADGENQQTIQTPSFDVPILEKISVAYVKDASNQEVKPRGDKETNQDAARIDVTSNPYKLELNMSKDDFLNIKKAVQNGYKLYFAY